jgi:hypothetical protein
MAPAPTPYIPAQILAQAVQGFAPQVHGGAILMAPTPRVVAQAAQYLAPQALYGTTQAALGQIVDCGDGYATVRPSQDEIDAEL